MNTTNSFRPLRGALVLALLAAVTGSASASDITLKNDTIGSGGIATLQGGFIPNETGAVVLSALPAQYPITLKELQVFVDKQTASAIPDMTAQLYVWSTSSISGTSPSLASAVYVSPTLTLGNGGFNLWDISSANITLSGSFTVGCKIVTNTNLGLVQGHQPNLVSDNSNTGCGKNWVRQTNGVWASLCSFGLQKNLLIRVKASTGNGTGQFIDLGAGLAGNFSPTIAGSGSLAGAGNFQISLAGLPPATTTTLIIGLSALSVPFKGGVLGPNPDLLIPLGTGAGAFNLNGSMPVGLPSNFKLWLQSWTPDAGGPVGLDATNTLQLITP